MFYDLKADYYNLLLKSKTVKSKNRLKYFETLFLFLVF